MGDASFLICFLKRKDTSPTRITCFSKLNRNKQVLTHCLVLFRYEQRGNAFICNLFSLPAHKHGRLTTVSGAFHSYRCKHPPAPRLMIRALEGECLFYVQKHTVLQAANF